MVKESRGREREEKKEGVASRFFNRRSDANVVVASREEKKISKRLTKLLAPHSFPNRIRLFALLFKRVRSLSVVPDRCSLPREC